LRVVGSAGSSNRALKAFMGTTTKEETAPDQERNGRIQEFVARELATIDRESERREVWLLDSAATKSVIRSFTNR
jgi:hypothetical protein